MGNKIDTLEEQQKIELNIFKDLHRWFEENGICYCMGYGTLLGAARHQGFIPWDNDMDILMPRPDFERMLELAKGKLIYGYIDILHHSFDDNYHYCWVKACDSRTRVTAPHLVDQIENSGLWVDIFPIDGFPEKKSLKDKTMEWAYKKLQRADISKSLSLPVTRTVKIILRALFPNRNNHHMRMVDKYAMLLPYEQAEYVGDMIDMKPIKMKRTEFENRILMKFEDAEFYAPSGWDEYLKKAYGNYMELPPVEKRETHIIDAEYVD